MTESDISKRSLGIYYTPENAAKIVATWAIRSLAERILEPSFGGCALLRAAADRLRILGAEKPLKNLTGFDIDINAFHHLSEFNGSNIDGDFQHLDFVDTRPTNKNISAIIANPPFTGYRKMTATQRKTVVAWQNEHPGLIPLDASLWAYFLLHSLNFLADGGRLAFVLPSSVASADYASKVRAHIETRFHKVQYIHVQNQLFLEEGASAKAVILLADQFSPSSPVSGEVEHYFVQDIHEISDVLFRSPSEAQANSATALDTSKFQLASKNLIDREATFFLGDVAQVIIGEVVGNVNFFVRNQSEWISLGIEAAYTKPIIRQHSTIPGLAVSLNNKKTLPRILNVGDRAHSDAISKFLNTYPKKFRDSNSTFKKRKFWYQPPYNTDADAFVASLTHRDFKIVANDAAVSCTNSIYKVILNKDSGLTGTMLACASLTTITQLSVELLSRTLGEGALKLEPSDVKKIAIPISALSISNTEAARLSKKLDALTRAGEIDKARKLADDYFLISKNLINKKSMEIFEKKLLDLRSTRLSRLL
ncbi:N-6 DNA methylase [Burkholderia ubonensis]|uniref:N-6 DNA methylase n=1 Tax=Burkholderia ubonensis TaxID=101571 RepID=UPI0009B434F4|nr:N-6 DNA methylase [Burkholderia ubonensis]